MRKILLITVVTLTLVIAILPGITSSQTLCEYSLFRPGRHSDDVLVPDGDPDTRAFFFEVLRPNHDDPLCPTPVTGIAILYEDIDGSGSLTGRDNILEIEDFPPTE